MHAPTHPQTVRAARTEFFRTNGFPPDGGYGDVDAEAAFGVLTYRVPNPPARAAALRLHDLHHVVTDYPTDWRGEAQISAWELASGFGVQPWAWMIMLWGMFTGLVLAPADTVRAFLRGRHSRNLYGAGLTPRLLDQPVGQLRRQLRVIPPERSPWFGRSVRQRARDVAALMGWSSAALAYGAVGLLPSLALVAYAALSRITPCLFDCSQPT